MYPQPFLLLSPGSCILNKPWLADSCFCSVIKQFFRIQFDLFVPGQHPATQDNPSGKLSGLPEMWGWGVWVQGTEEPHGSALLTHPCAQGVFLHLPAFVPCVNSVLCHHLMRLAPHLTPGAGLHVSEWTWTSNQKGLNRPRGAAPQLA